MLNHFAKIYNQTPKPESKTQLRKANEAKTPVYRCCNECGEHGVTLYQDKTNKTVFWCKEHRPM